MKTIVKAAWLYVENRKLLYTRTKGKPWFFLPGGKINHGETLEQALIREIKEECGVDLLTHTIKHHNTITGHATGQPEDVFVESHMFFAEPYGVITPCSEIEELRYLSSADTNLTTTVGIEELKLLKSQGLID